MYQRQLETLVCHVAVTHTLVRNTHGEEGRGRVDWRDVLCCSPVVDVSLSKSVLTSATSPMLYHTSARWSLDASESALSRQFRAMSYCCE